MDNKTDSKPVLCDSKYLLLSSYHRARKRCPDCLLILKRKRLFAGGPPANKNLFAGGPLANKKLFAGGPPANKKLFAGGLPANKNLFARTLAVLCSPEW